MVCLFLELLKILVFLSFNIWFFVLFFSFNFLNIVDLILLTSDFHFFAIYLAILKNIKHVHVYIKFICGGLKNCK